MTRSQGNKLEPLTYSIVIPAYDESARIGATLDKVIAYATQSGWNAEILVVDDGSHDSTPAIVTGYAQKSAMVRLVSNPGNRGKGFSVRNGMLHAQGAILLFTDADLSSPIEEAEKLFAALRSGSDVAIGSRWVRTELQVRKQPLFRRILGRIFNLLLRLVLGLDYKDTQCGFKAFTRRAAQAVFPLQHIERWGFDPELLFLASRFNFKVSEVPVKWAHRDGTRIHPIKDGLHMFFDLLRVRWNALTGKYKLDGTYAYRVAGSTR
jgi:glycosyltransferase involved in cell wall biosynthesis